MWINWLTFESVFSTKIYNATLFVRYIKLPAQKVHHFCVDVVGEEVDGC